MSEPADLVALTEASRMLAEAKTLPNIRAVHNLAQRAKDYARAARLGLDAQNSAAAIALEAEAKAGELLAHMAAAGERRTARTANPSGLPLIDAIDEGPQKTVTLADLGVTPDESSRWQAVAQVPPEVRAEYVTESQERDQEVTRAGLLRHAGVKPPSRHADAERVFDAMQTAESRRRSDAYRFGALVMEVSEVLDRIDPPLSITESEPHIVTLEAVLRRLRRRGLEALG